MVVEQDSRCIESLYPKEKAKRRRLPLNRVNTPFSILVIESKNTTVDAMEGLPQLLTYAYKSLELQTSVWVLTTNGIRYQSHLKYTDFICFWNCKQN